MNYGKAKAFLMNITNAVKDSMNITPDPIEASWGPDNTMVAPYEGGAMKGYALNTAENDVPFNPFMDKSRPGNVVGGTGPNESGGNYAEFWAGSSPNTNRKAEDAGQIIDGVWVTDSMLAAMIEKRIRDKRALDNQNRVSIANGNIPFRSVYNPNVQLKEVYVESPYALSDL